MIFDFYNLDAELNGVPTQNGGSPTGLLREKLPLVTKYWLTDLAKKVSAEKIIVEELKNEIIKKYGVEEKEGSISIPLYIDDEEDQSETKRKILNPNYVSFEKEFSELLNTEKDLEYKPIKLSDLGNLETTENYATLFKLIRVEETSVVPM